MPLAATASQLIEAQWPGMTTVRKAPAAPEPAACSTDGPPRGACAVHTAEDVAAISVALLGAVAAAGVLLLARSAPSRWHPHAATLGMLIVAIAVVVVVVLALRGGWPCTLQMAMVAMGLRRLWPAADATMPPPRYAQHMERAPHAAIDSW